MNTYEKSKIVDDFMSNLSMQEPQIVHHGYDDVTVSVFMNTLDNWRGILKRQDEVWIGGTQRLSMEHDWCTYARTAWKMIPQEFKATLRKENSDVLPSDCIL